LFTGWEGRLIIGGGVDFYKNLKSGWGLYFEENLPTRAHTYTTSLRRVIAIYDIPENINIKSARAPINNECETKP